MLTESNRVRVAALVTVLALAGVACSGSIAHLPYDAEDRCLPCTDAACALPLELTFLGAGGFVMKRGEDTIVVDPFFSNPSITTVALGRMRSNEAAVRRWMPYLPEASAILVGHAHYDHLLDVPTVAREMAPNATIYASETAKNVLGAYNLYDRTEEICPGCPITIGRVRVLPIRSEHAPHFLGITLMQGEHRERLAKRPKSALFGWLEGRTFAFAIDFLGDDGLPDFRVLFHDSAAEPDVGWPPDHLPAAHVRVAIPCVASFSQVEGYPESIETTFDPDFLVLGHWEDFFTPYSQSPDDVRSVRGTDVDEFLGKLPSEWKKTGSMPLPGVKIRIAKNCPPR